MISLNKKITLTLLLLQGAMAYSQVGIGTETPSEEFEVKGNLRFRQLENQSSHTHYRQVRSDNEGNLTAIQNNPDGMSFDNLVRQFMSGAVAVNSTADLGVVLKVVLAPNSETTVIISYNIPVYIRTDFNKTHPYFAGVQLKRGVGAMSDILYGASRKFSFPLAFPSNAEIKRGMFVDGKFVDVLNNPSSQATEVEYRLNGFIEGPSTTVFFGDSTSTSNSGSMGVGVMSAMVFNRTF